VIELSQPEVSIIKQGDTDQTMFFLAKGYCEVFIMDDQKVNRFEHGLKPGNFFGEINMIFNCNRTATVKSKNYCNLAKHDLEQFEEITADFPMMLERLKYYIRDNYQIKNK
jgi:CRP-like cAMP-binding protein